MLRRSAQEHADSISARRFRGRDRPSSCGGRGARAAWRAFGRAGTMRSKKASPWLRRLQNTLQAQDSDGHGADISCCRFAEKSNGSINKPRRHDVHTTDFRENLQYVQSIAMRTQLRPHLHPHLMRFLVILAYAHDILNVQLTAIQPSRKTPSGGLRHRNS